VPLRDAELVDAKKEMLRAWRRDRRRSGTFSELVRSVRPAAASELRGGAANAVLQALPSDRQQLEQILWKFLSTYTAAIFDKAADTRLSRLGPKVSVGVYLRWLESNCIPAVIEDVCTPMMGQFDQTIQHVYDILGDGRGSQRIESTKRALAGLLKEVMSGPYTENLENRLRTYLTARVGHWESQAIERWSGLTRPEAKHEPADGSSVRPAVGIMKRGRPQIITDEKKIAAAKLKANGGTNREVAKLLYGTRFPTPQQTKNVPSILRHHNQRSKKSSGTNPQSLTKTQ
jgi:hypothetical protein